ncbi:uncharacterized protein A1O9_05906 [Exophiala aquamarina CBS 119918]|uniref:EXPERA domain-containing protein n=1 Tax=Exophiala aquamarina CBS 119918 TaxID=1182545 RepID=A0A072PFD2_9EURO|nr:uncharacterized protein A1O9_05906 [Exophiala aquamarina CBS 119918]KEF57983.1 hypothetical protein A1O9_05906 [Exophiala aquamarina CBS 119918]
MAVSSQATNKKSRSNRPSAAKRDAGSTRFIHTIPPMFMIWLTFSLPLVMWDTGYIFLRPHSMPGGKYHSPVWKLYALYGTVDHVYGWPAWDSHSGFTAAQASLNVIETVMYIYYLVVIWRSSAKDLYAFRDIETLFLGNRQKTVSGPGIATAVLVLFSATVMTISKTVLYWANEYFSGFASIGHNAAWDLFWLWILPNGLWIIFPGYIAYLLGDELVNALEGASGNERED